jgi:hypothetical protein
MFGNFPCSKLLVHLAWNSISIKLVSTPVLNLSSKTLALDCENSEDVPDDSEEQYYKEPDLSGGIEGVD